MIETFYDFLVNRVSDFRRKTPPEQISIQIEDFTDFLYDYCEVLNEDNETITVKINLKQLVNPDYKSQYKNEVKEAFKKVFGYYPETGEKSAWTAFQKGYETATNKYEDY